MSSRTSWRFIAEALSHAYSCVRERERIGGEWERGRGVGEWEGEGEGEKERGRGVGEMGWSGRDQKRVRKWTNSGRHRD